MAKLHKEVDAARAKQMEADAREARDLAQAMLEEEKAAGEKRMAQLKADEAAARKASEEWNAARSPIRSPPKASGAADHGAGVGFAYPEVPKQAASTLSTDKAVWGKNAEMATPPKPDKAVWGSQMVEQVQAAEVA